MATPTEYFDAVLRERWQFLYLPTIAIEEWQSRRTDQMEVPGAAGAEECWRHHYLSGEFREMAQRERELPTPDLTEADEWAVIEETHDLVRPKGFLPLSDRSVVRFLSTRIRFGVLRAPGGDLHTEHRPYFGHLVVVLERFQPDRVLRIRRLCSEALNQIRRQDPAKTLEIADMLGVLEKRRRKTKGKS